MGYVVRILVLACVALGCAAGGALAHPGAPAGSAFTAPGRLVTPAFDTPRDAARVLGADLDRAPAPLSPAALPPNVEAVTNIPELRGAISIYFMGDTMFVSTVSGVFSYDVSNPRAPRRVGVLARFIYENEDVDADPVRKRLFIARDPRGIAGTTEFPEGAVEIIDVADPANMREIGRFSLPVGHTSTCINGCDFLWTGGPARGQGQPSDWGGRPIFATDVRDPARPVTCREPLDLGRNDGKTDYAHDVQVDSAGIAWVSGRGGVRGYWTSGRHRNPVTGREEEAGACTPIPYAGGGTPESATPSRFMHNSLRLLDRTVAGERGRVLYGTEENVTSSCASSGRAVTYDLAGSFDGEGFRDIATTKFRMRVLDTWTPQGQEGATGCDSAHYFTDRGDGIQAWAFYGQGVRFLDVSDPTDIRQIGFFRAQDANAFAAYFHKGFVFVADVARGVDVLRYTGPGPGNAPPNPAGEGPAPTSGGPGGPGRGRFLISRRTVALRGGAIRAALSCRSSAPCRGTLRLVVDRRSRAGRPVRRLTLGRRAFLVPAGRRAIVPVALDPAARRALRGSGRVRVLALARVESEAAGRRSRTTTASFAVARR